MCDKMAADVAIELREFNVTCLSFWTTVIQTELFMNSDLLTKEVGDFINKLFALKWIQQ